MDLVAHAIRNSKAYLVGVGGAVVGVYVAIQRGDWFLAVISVALALVLLRLIETEFHLADQS
jgi:uncharacterized membrane protein